MLLTYYNVFISTQQKVIMSNMQLTLTYLQLNVYNHYYIFFN